MSEKSEKNSPVFKTVGSFTKFDPARCPTVSFFCFVVWMRTWIPRSCTSMYFLLSVVDTLRTLSTPVHRLIQLPCKSSLVEFHPTLAIFAVCLVCSALHCLTSLISSSYIRLVFMLLPMVPMVIAGVLIATYCSSRRSSGRGEWHADERWRCEAPQILKCRSVHLYVKPVWNSPRSSTNFYVQLQSFPHGKKLSLPVWCTNLSHEYTWT